MLHVVFLVSEILWSSYSCWKERAYEVYDTRFVSLCNWKYTISKCKNSLIAAEILATLFNMQIVDVLVYGCFPLKTSSA